MTNRIAEPIRVPSRRVAKLFGVTTKTVDRWAELGIMRPTGRGRLLFNSLDVLTAVVARDLRARGFKLNQCTTVANWLQQKGLTALRAEWQHGQHLLLTIGANEPFHRQFSHGEIFDNPSIDLAAAFALGLPIAVVDIQAAYDQLKHELAGVVE